MPAAIVVAHDDPEFREGASMTLLAAGYDITSYACSMEALAALEAAEGIELLITRVTFQERNSKRHRSRPHGKGEKPGVRVLFVARIRNRQHTDGLGDFLAMPATGSEIVAAVERTLADGAA